MNFCKSEIEGITIQILLILQQDCEVFVWILIPSISDLQKFTEGYCKYDGYLLENLSNITTISTCQFACQLYDKEPSCEYFSYNSLEQNCQFLSSSIRTCDIIRGPPTPSLEECSEGPSKYYITDWYLEYLGRLLIT